MHGDALNRIKRRRRAAKKTNTAERTPLVHQSGSRSRRLTAGRQVRADLVYSTLPLLCLSTRSSPRRPRRVRMCGRGIRGIRAVYAVEDILYGKRGKREREGELHSRWSLLFEARKESRDERTSSSSSSTCGEHEKKKKKKKRPRRGG